MSSLVSVVVPAYNAASRIRFTLESLIAQDYKDMEIVFVDDASRDGTVDIAREILEESGINYRLLTHGHNMGVSSARNTGLEASRGKYVCFVDADDLLCSNFISCLHRSIDQGKYDVSFCGLTDRFSDGRSDREMRFSRGLYIGSSGENVIMNNSVPPFMCCMYSSDFLRVYGLRFHAGCTSGEDVEFQMKAFCRAERISFTDECPYIYMHHENMGSVRDNDTREKKILRYEHNTQAQRRTAEYLCEYAKSQPLRDIAGKILMPQSSVRYLNLAAMKNNRQKYNLLLKDEEAMKILRRALCSFTLRKKPEVFVKALMIMIMPGIYYNMRAK